MVLGWDVIKCQEVIAITLGAHIYQSYVVSYFL